MLLKLEAFHNGDRAEIEKNLSLLNPLTVRSEIGFLMLIISAYTVFQTP